MPGATLLTLAGIWVIVQVTMGNALGRLGIAGDPDHAAPPPLAGGLPPGHVPGTDPNGHPF